MTQRFSKVWNFGSVLFFFLPHHLLITGAWLHTAVRVNRRKNCDTKSSYRWRVWQNYRLIGIRHREPWCSVPDSLCTIPDWCRSRKINMYMVLAQRPMPRVWQIPCWGSSGHCGWGDAGRWGDKHFAGEPLNLPRTLSSTSEHLGLIFSFLSITFSLTRQSGRWDAHYWLERGAAGWRGEGELLLSPSELRLSAASREDGG